MRRTRIEHILFALPPLATEERTFGIGSSVPESDIMHRSKRHPIQSPRQRGRAVLLRLRAADTCYRFAFSLPKRFKISGTNLSENPAMNPQMIAFAFAWASAGAQ